MKPLSAILAALALVSASSVQAGPKKKKIADSPETPTLPHIAPLVVELPKSEPEAPKDPCAEILTISPHDDRVPVDVTFMRLAGPAKTRMIEAKKISTDIGVEVTASKRRLFLAITGQMTSHDPSGGQTGYYARQRPAKLLDIPVGCEIASVGNAKGTIDDEGPATNDTIKVFGTGLVEGATCQYEGPFGFPTCTLTLGKVEVRLRSAQVTCDALAVHPMHLMGPRGLVSEAGDADLDGDRINLDLQVAFTANQGRVAVKTSLSLEQVGGDHSRYGGSTRDVLFILAEDAPGCRLKGASRRDGRIRLTTAAQTDNGPRMYTPIQGTGGLLMNARCNTDTPGMDSGHFLGCGVLEVQPFVLELRPDDGSKGGTTSKYKKKIAGG